VQNQDGNRLNNVWEENVEKNMWNICKWFVENENEKKKFTIN
jgi:hypothetical protein